MPSWRQEIGRCPLLVSPGPGDWDAEAPQQMGLDFGLVELCKAGVAGPGLGFTRYAGSSVSVLSSGLLFPKWGGLKLVPWKV